MFFRSIPKTLWQRLPGLLLAFLFLPACGLPLFESPPPRRSLQFKSEPTECLSRSLDHIKDYFQGKGEAQVISNSWACTVRAIDAFTESTRGQESDRYSPRELANFLETYFLIGFKINDELLFEAMRVKQLFVGGSLEHITRLELEKTKEVIEFFRESSLTLLPYMKIYSQNWDVSKKDIAKDFEAFEEANKALHLFAEQLGERIGKSNLNYDIRNFIKLLHEVEVLYDGKWNFLGTLNEMMPVLGKVKKALAGGHDYIVQKDEWKRFLVLGFRSYAHYLRYNYFIEDQELEKSGDITFIIRSIDDIGSMIFDMVMLKDERMVSKDEIKDVLLSLSGLWPQLKVNDKLMDHYMELKRLFLGGDLETIRPADVRNIQDKLIILEQLGKSLIPILPYMTLELQGQLTDSQARSYQGRAKHMLDLFAELGPQLMETSYSFSRFEDFLGEMQRLYSPESTQDYMSLCLKYFPLMRQLKSSLLSEPGDQIEADEWAEIFSIFSFGYSEFLEYSYFVGESASEKSKKKYFEQLADGAVQLVARLLELKGSPYIDLKEFDELLVELLKHTDQLEYVEGISQDLFTLKALLLGGSNHLINAHELRQVLRNYHLYSSVWEDFSKYLSYFNKSWRPQYTSDSSDNAYRIEAEQSLKRLLGQLSTQLQQDISFTELLAMLRRFDQFTGGRIDLDIDGLERQLPLFRVMKKELLGHPGDLIRREQWSRLLEWVSEAYFGYLQFYYFVEHGKGSYLEGDRLVNLKDVFDRGVFLTSQIVSAQGGGALPIASLRRILIELEKSVELPLGVGANFYGSSFEYLFNRFFLDEDRRDAITTKSLSRLSTEFNAWYDIQQKLEVTFGARSGWTRSEVLDKWSKLITAEDQMSIQVRTFKEMFRALNNPYALTHNKRGELRLLVQNNEPLYQFSDLSAINWKRAVLRLLIRAYAQDPVRKQNLVGLNNDEANAVFDDMKDFAAELGFIDPSHHDFMNSRFMEANIFTLRSNGDKIYDFEEGIEQFSLLSSGIVINSQQTPRLIESCGSPGMLVTVKYQTTLPLDCVFDKMIEDLDLITRNMPGVGETFKGLSYEEQIEMLEDVALAANVELIDGKYSTITSIELISQTLQYIESLFVRFDTDKDGVVNTKEAEAAYPVFESLLREVSPLPGEGNLKAIFTYMLRYGEVPSMRKIHKFAWWRVRPGAWDVSADRRRLARVMAEVRLLIKADIESKKQNTY